VVQETGEPLYDALSPRLSKLTDGPQRRRVLLALASMERTLPRLM
jgi:hypothetical protein